MELTHRIVLSSKFNMRAWHCGCQLLPPYASVALYRCNSIGHVGILVNGQQLFYRLSPSVMT